MATNPSALRLTCTAPPLVFDDDGVVRVEGTRVTLDTLIVAFKQGATPETIAQQYPSVSLPDVYAVIAYYLQNVVEVDAYFANRQATADAVRAENEARFDATGLRARLLSRCADPER